MPKVKRYLGDGVYADFDGYQIVLTTEYGHGATNTIFLEPSVIEQLFDYCADVNSQPTPVRDKKEGSE